jgi:hypothetical protein
LRRSRGQVALALNIVIAIFVVGSLGLVSYEMSRILLAREQLKHCLELASLAGGASIASTSATGVTAQTQATTIALNILNMNSVLGQGLNGHVNVCTSVAALNPAPGQTSVYFEFDDPITKAPPAAGAQGNVLRVYGAYAYPLFAGGFGSIGVNTYTLLAEAMAGMPALDLIIVDNTSGSMDDQTNVTMVRRHWDQVTGNNIIYSIPESGPGGGADGPINGVVCPNIAGSQVNGIPPQNLDAAGDPRTSNCPKEFSEVGSLGTTVPLRGITNGSGPGDAPPGGPPSGGVGMGGLAAGPGYVGEAPPGNVTLLPDTHTAPVSAPASTPFSAPASATSFKPAWTGAILSAVADAIVPPAYAHYTNAGIMDYETANTYGASTSLFTDLVVNLDGNQTFGGYISPNFPGYPFPSLDYLVEASRGTMENGGTAPTAWISNGLNGASKDGYQKVYQAIAYGKLQPKATIETALNNFMTKVSQTSDCHFGFVAFADRAGTSPADTYNAPMVSSFYPVAGNTIVALPHVPLTAASNNVASITTLLTPPKDIGGPPLMAPNGGCNLADGLTQAYADLTGAGTRTGAMKAIVVLTDKVPTRDLAGNKYDPTSNSAALADAITVASQCSKQGIPIFMVTLDQTPGQQMTPYLQTQYSDSAPGGLVNTAGHGGALYINNWVNQNSGSVNLNGSFNNVVRQLCKIVQG